MIIKRIPENCAVKIANFSQISIFRMEDILLKIRDFADNAHGDQMRKFAPDRYIVHPMRVMQTCAEYNNSLTVLSAALLHDVLEDTPVTEGELLDFLKTLMAENEAKHTLGLVIEMTDVFVKSAYPHLNRRARKERELERIVKTSAEAQTIKYADILDNSFEIAENDPDFAKRYLSECLAILKKADKGNPVLREQARAAVRSKLR